MGNENQGVNGNKRRKLTENELEGYLEENPEGDQRDSIFITIDRNRTLKKTSSVAKRKQGISAQADKTKSCSVQSEPQSPKPAEPNKPAVQVRNPLDYEVHPDIRNFPPPRKIEDRSDLSERIVAFLIALAALAVVIFGAYYYWVGKKNKPAPFSAPLVGDASKKVEDGNAVRVPQERKKDPGTITKKSEEKPSGYGAGKKEAYQYQPPPRKSGKICPGFADSPCQGQRQVYLCRTYKESQQNAACKGVCRFSGKRTKGLDSIQGSQFFRICFSNRNAAFISAGNAVYHPIALRP